MLDNDIMRLGSSPFADQNQNAPQAAAGRMERFASDEGITPVALPPRLWAPLQQPQKSGREVKLLNKTAPITASTRPYTVDAAPQHGAAGLVAALGGSANGG